MKTGNKILYTVSAILILYTASYSQDTKGLTRIGIHINGVKLLGGERDGSNISHVTGLSAGYSLSPNILLEFEAGFGWVRPRDLDSHFAVLKSAPYKTFLRPWSLNIKYHFFKNKSIQPFISAGSGLTHWNLRDISNDDKWFSIPESGTSVYGKKHNITIWGGVGFSSNISEGLDVEFEIKYGHLIHQTIDNIGIGDKNSGIAEVRLSLLYLLNFKKDSDKDGIPDKEDAAPEQPEDFNGFEDSDGMPDLDNDKDGILDSVDKSPNEPETYNGYLDDDGIPDEKPTPLSLIPGESFIPEGFTFAVGSAELTAASKNGLEQIFVYLRETPASILEIRGFADNSGSAVINLKLSQKRADSVKSYLVGLGIKTERLKAIGYGEAISIASNKTETGREKNRRVEFIMLEE